MEIPKGVRRFFSADYRKYQGQLKQMDKSVPKGAPSLTAPGKTPVGPNRFEGMDAKERKSHSPDYPVNYSVPVESKERGWFRKSPTFVPNGERAAFTTGPGLLPPEHRVPGRFDYDTIPDITVRPVGADGYPSAATGMTRPAKQGLPADPETGFPKIPDLRSGSFKIEESYPARREDVAAAHSRAMARHKPSLDSLGYPKVPD